MTLADHLSEEDLLLLTEPEPTPASRREPPPGAEAMARPWRLGVVGLGITVGLVTRLLAANGYFSINSRTLVYAAAVTSLLAGIGLIALAAERDRFDRWMLLLAGGTGLSLGALQWVSPNFASGTLEWSNADQVALAILGVGNGVLLAGILTLAFVRRWPTMTVVGVLAAGVLTLATDSVLLRNEWPAIAALALAFGGVLLAWDQAPRHEPAYPEQTQSPRISRAALSLATVALGGSVVQLWLSRGESVRRVLPAGVLSAVLVLLAFLAMIRIRREIQRRETSLNEWTSWMREIRTGDLASDFETMGTTPSGGVIGDVTGEAPRPLSFPDLRVEDPAPTLDELPAPADLPETTGVPAAPPEPVATPTAPTIDVPDVAPAVDVPSPATPALPTPAVAMPDVVEPSFALPDAEAEPVAAALDVPAAEIAPSQPRLFGDELPAASEVVWADDLAEPDTGPAIADDQPSLFDYDAATEPAPLSEAPLSQAPLAEAPKAPAIPLPPSIATPTEPAAPEPVVPSPGASPSAEVVAPAAVASFSTWLGDDDSAVAPAAPGEPLLAAESGAFSTWLDDSAPATVVGTIDDLARWLAAAPAHGQSRLVAAVETMSLVDFDELPSEVSGAASGAMLERLSQLAPQPTLVAPIDGPYLMAAWDSADHTTMVQINRTVLDAMSTPVPTEYGAVGLTGTLALLRPQDGATLDDVIDQAIQGLVQARQLEAIAGENR